MVVEAASFSLRPNLMTSTPLLAAAGRTCSRQTLVESMSPVVFFRVSERTGDWKMSLAFLAEVPRILTWWPCNVGFGCSDSFQLHELIYQQMFRRIGFNCSAGAPQASDTVDSVASCAAATACTTSACWRLGCKDQ